MEADPGSDVNITCVAVGSPMPRVLWREGARDLHSGEIADIPIGRNILMLKDVRESKNYTCVASSTLGNIESDVLVKVKGRSMFSVVNFFLTLYMRQCETYDFIQNCVMDCRKGFLDCQIACVGN